MSVFVPAAGSTSNSRAASSALAPVGVVATWMTGAPIRVAAVGGWNVHAATPGSLPVWLVRQPEFRMGSNPAASGPATAVLTVVMVALLWNVHAPVVSPARCWAV